MQKTFWAFREKNLIHPSKLPPMPYPIHKNSIEKARWILESSSRTMALALLNYYKRNYYIVHMQEFLWL